MRVDDRPRNREPYAEPVRLRRDEGSEQGAVDMRRQARSGIAHRELDIGGPDCGRDREAPPGLRGLGHRVDRIHHQVHQHLLQEHRIAADDARTRRQIDGCFNLPRPHVVSDERQALMDDGVKVDRFPVQLMTSQHRPMPLDDLRGLDALGPDVR